MGFWSSLAKIGGIAAAPFTGGASLIPTALGVAGDIGSVLGGQEKGASQGRVTQAELNLAQDRNALAKYQAEQGAQNQGAQIDLDRKKYADSAAGQNATRALLSGLLGGGQLSSSLGIPGITSPTLAGGPLAALKGNPEALAALATLGARSSAAQQSEPTFSGGNILAAPNLTPLPEAGKGSGFLSTLARIGEVAGAAAPSVAQIASRGQSPGTPPFIDPAVAANLGKSTKKVTFGNG